MQEIKNITHEIDGNKYVIYQFPLKKSMAGLGKLTSNFGPSVIDFWLVSLGGAVNAKDLLSLKITTKELGSIKELCRNAEGKIEELFEFFVNQPAYIKCNGEEVDLNKIYSTKGLGHLVVFIV